MDLGIQVLAFPDLGEIEKAVYVWRPRNVKGGDPVSTVDAFIEAGISTVAVKIVDGTWIYNDVQPLIDEARRRGLKVGAWGYTYLKWNALGEAYTVIKAVDMYKPDFYLVDAEKEAKLQSVAAKVYASVLYPALRKRGILFAVNSYWKPTYHPDFPWKELRAGSHFDAPQVYWRGYAPGRKYHISKAEYAALTPKLPFAMPAGDMFLEAGVKPTPQQVIEFVNTARHDGANGVIMWSADQNETTPELWAAFASYDWKAGTVKDGGPDIPPVDEVPLWVGVTTASANLRVRSGPGLTFNHLYSLQYGSRVEVWEIRNKWIAIKKDRSEWVSSDYVKLLK